MSMRPYTKPYRWELEEVKSPHIPAPVTVIVARSIPYVPNANRFQNLTIYLPDTSVNRSLLGKPVASLEHGQTPVPRIHVHVHGGAWRDPFLSSRSIEAEVAHAFTSEDKPISTVVSLNYTLSPFPAHPSAPYDPTKGDRGDPGREAQHPMHIHDVLNGLALLKELGLGDASYVLSGHSCGGFLAFQACLFAPEYWKFSGGQVPIPAALIGMNALLGLSDLVHDLGDSHEHLRPVYENLQRIAFGDESTWDAASPLLVDIQSLADRVAAAKAPRLVLLDQSVEDQLVPLNQTEKMQARLDQVKGLKVIRSHHCTGAHAAPWEQGYMIWDCVRDTLERLQ